MIIAFSGAKFAGKDTAAEILIKKHKFKRVGLADKLKDICSSVFSVERAHMDDPCLKEKPFESTVTITEKNIEDLFKIIQADGFEFNYDLVLQNACKSFEGKELASIRDMLQIVGTNICRTYVTDDIWLLYIKSMVKDPCDNFVVTDARFKNERDFFKSIGALLVLVKRPSNLQTSSHISENQLGEDSEYDVLVTNDTTVTALQSGIDLWFGIKQYDIISNFRK